jgi:hypothetical protein
VSLQPWRDASDDVMLRVWCLQSSFSKWLFPTQLFLMSRQSPKVETGKVTRVGAERVREIIATRREHHDDIVDFAKARHVLRTRKYDRPV